MRMGSDHFLCAALMFNMFNKCLMHRKWSDPEWERE